jgi:hypothetical protein
MVETKSLVLTQHYPKGCRIVAMPERFSEWDRASNV